MALQHEWTSPVTEPEVYPGVLRGYRHFKNANILSAIYSNFDYPQVAEGEWWVAQCGTEANPRNEHAAPEKSCRCGFYVNYYSTNSFYDSSRELPRGVVEASGRMVLGEKGFRAQKLRLVALTPVSYALGAHVAELFPWVKLYTSTKKMYEDYPQDDLTSLLGEEIVNKNLNSPPEVQISRDTLANITAANNYALNMYGGYGRIPQSVSSGSQLMSIQRLIAVTAGQGIIYQGNLFDGVKLTIHPHYDHLRIERHDPNFSIFDYSQFGNPSYVGPYNGPPHFVQDIKLSDLNNCMIEVSSDYQVMYQLAFDYQGIQYEWNFVDGTSKWRKIY